MFATKCGITCIKYMYLPSYMGWWIPHFILFIIDFLLQMWWIHKQGMIGRLNKHNVSLLLLNAFHLCQFPLVVE